MIKEEKLEYRHKKESEWLTIDICREYQKKGKGLSHIAKRELQFELMERCDVTELQAINIINGFNICDYVDYYDRMRNNIALKEVDSEYIEWLAQKDIERANRDTEIENED